MGPARIKNPPSGRSREPLVVRDIRVEESAVGVTLSGRLQTSGIELPPTLWFQFPPGLAPFIGANGDPFFPAALLLAMAHARRLVIEADVSAALLAAAPRIMENYHGLRIASGGRFQRVEVVAVSASRKDRGPMAGAFFSCGVDSFYTLLRNVARYPTEDSRLISHLILVHGWDIPLDQPDFFQTVCGQAEVVAQALGKTPVPVRTNVRDVLRGVEWPTYSVGPAMASVGLSLGPLFHTVFIAADRAFRELRPNAISSHPGLDPLWSTETLEFVHDGADTKKADKIPVVASSPLALRVLRVCWENRDGAYNCGRCPKCLNTMVLLDLHGVLNQTGQLPHTFHPRDIGGLDLPAGRFRRILWKETLARVKAVGGPVELIEAIETALARGAWAESRPGRLCAAVSGVLSRVGLTPERLKAVDRALLQGAGLARFRRLQRRPTAV